MPTATQNPYTASPAADRRSDGNATAAMVLGILGLFVLTPIPGVVGLFLARNATTGGKRTAGVILGWVQIGLAVLALLLIAIIATGSRG